MASRKSPPIAPPPPLEPKADLPVDSLEEAAMRPQPQRQARRTQPRDRRDAGAGQRPRK